MRRHFWSLPLKFLVLSTLIAAATPTRAQTLLQELEPGSVTEGAFVDLFYHPEPRRDDQLTPSQPTEHEHKHATKHKNQSHR